MKRQPSGDVIHFTSKRVLPYYRSVNILSVVVRYLEKLGMNSDELLAGSGIQSCDLDDPDVFVTPEQEFKVMRKVIGLTSDPTIAFVLGQQYHIGVYNKIGAAVSASETLLEALKVLFQYIDLTMTYFQYDLLVRGGLVLITIKELIDLKELRAFICEREFSAAHRILCDALQMRIPLKEVQLAYPRPPHFSAYKKAFQCPVRFNAATHRVVFDSKYLLMRLPMANPLMKKTYEKECRQLCLRLQVQKSVSDQVRQNIFFGADGRPSMSQLSRNLSVSSRTLRRWLAEEGTSFKVLSSEIIREKAIHLIQTTSWSMERIAAELGYSNLPNFYRAFGHWTGRKPGDYRGKNRWRKPP